MFLKQVPLRPSAASKVLHFLHSDRDINDLATLSPRELFVGKDPYAKRGQEGCALFSLRWYGAVPGVILLAYKVSGRALRYIYTPRQGDIGLCFVFPSLMQSAPVMDLLAAFWNSVASLCTEYACFGQPPQDLHRYKVATRRLESSRGLCKSWCGCWQWQRHNIYLDVSYDRCDCCLYKVWRGDHDAKIGFTYKQGNHDSLWWVLRTNSLESGNNLMINFA